MSHGVLAHRILQGFQRFEIEVLRRDGYIQLGVCHIPFDLRMCTLGTSLGVLLRNNWLYPLARAEGKGKQFVGAIPTIVAGDKIGFAVNVDKREMTFYHNGNRIAHCTEAGVPGKDLYPCAFLGGMFVVVRIQPTIIPVRVMIASALPCRCAVAHRSCLRGERISLTGSVVCSGNLLQFIPACAV